MDQARAACGARCAKDPARRIETSERVSRDQDPDLRWAPLPLVHVVAAALKLRKGHRNRDRENADTQHITVRESPRSHEPRLALTCAASRYRPR